MRTGTVVARDRLSATYLQHAKPGANCTARGRRWGSQGEGHRTETYRTRRQQASTAQPRLPHTNAILSTSSALPLLNHAGYHLDKYLLRQTLRARALLLCRQALAAGASGRTVLHLEAYTMPRCRAGAPGGSPSQELSGGTWHLLSSRRTWPTYRQSWAVSQ